MTRKLLAWILIVLSALFFVLSAAGIVAALAFNEPLTRGALARLDAVDSELRVGEEALGKSHAEIERALHILDAAEAALNQFTKNDPQAFFTNVQTTLNDKLLPELATAQERLVSARDTLQNVRVVVFGLNLVPFVNINIPDQTLADLIDSADALESQVADVGGLAEQASVLLKGATPLFGGDLLAGARKSLEGFRGDVEAYQRQVKGWRGQITDLKTSLPLWVDLASAFLAVFFLWFGLSQVSLFLHGRAILRGENPWEELRPLFRFRRREKS